MFDFQKEVVINDVKNVKVNAEKGIFVIDGMTYKVNNVVEKTVYETEPVPGKKATITIPLAKVADGKKQVRIVIIVVLLVLRFIISVSQFLSISVMLLLLRILRLLLRL